MSHKLKYAWVAAVGLLLIAADLQAGEALPKPGPKDKCPVCGMFVAKYPDWTAAVRFRTASRRSSTGSRT